jgi:hypothetical protein
MQGKPAWLATVVEPHVDGVVRTAAKRVSSDSRGARRRFPRARESLA